MLRRFTTRPVSSCLAPLLCAPAAMRADVRPASATSAREVQFVGAYSDYRNQIQAWAALDDNDRLEPADKWMWPFAQQFTKLVHDPTLSLPDAPERPPPMHVFARMHIDEKILLKGRWTGDARSHVYDHCRIEDVLNDVLRDDKLKLTTPKIETLSERERQLHAELIDELDRLGPEQKQVPKSTLMRAEKWRDLHTQLQAEIVDHHGSIQCRCLDRCQRLVGRLSDALQTAAQDSYCGFSRISLCCLSLLELCEFSDFDTNDALATKVRAPDCEYRFFGRACRPKEEDEAGIYFVESRMGDLMLIVEDKAEKEEGEPDGATVMQGQLGQVVGELLCLLRPERAFRHVFVARFDRRFRVTFFRLVDIDRPTLAAMAESKSIPTKKLRLLSTAKDPTVDRGWSLIDKAERNKALQMMANIRSLFLAK